jgi:hypothetical protein
VNLSPESGDESPHSKKLRLFVALRYLNTLARLNAFVAAFAVDWVNLSDYFDFSESSDQKRVDKPAVYREAQTVRNRSSE